LAGTKVYVVFPARVPGRLLLHSTPGRYERNVPESHLNAELIKSD
jgi:hypothetical protein